MRTIKGLDFYLLVDSEAKPTRYFMRFTDPLRIKRTEEISEQMFKDCYESICSDTNFNNWHRRNTEHSGDVTDEGLSQGCWSSRRRRQMLP